MTTTLRALLVGPRGHGGEGVYMERLRDHPPQGVQYDFAGDHHQGAAGAPCQVGHEVLLNQIVHRLAAPDMGFRALRLRERFDLVHVHAHPVRLRDLDGAPLIMSEGSSSGIYLRDYVGWGEARLARAFARTRTLYRLCGVADRLHALHRATLAYVFSDWARTANLRWGADPEKLRVLYPGFADPGPRPTIDRDTFTFLFVGRDFERKGGFELLEAMRVLSRDHPHVRLLLAGSDPSEHNPVRSWVSDSRRKRGLALAVDLERNGFLERRPWTHHALLADVWRAADAFVMPTHAEGFGFTRVEAMSYGLPVITSTAGPATELVASGHTGMLVEAGDGAGILDAMSSLVEDPQNAGRMGDAGRLAYLARFTRDRFRTGLRALYEEALSA